jgi:alpha-tubulin suppressor-like RCC1 family protein
MRLLAAALLTLGLFACSAEPIGPDLVPVASVTLEPANPVVGVGQRAPLTATPKSQNGTVLPNRTITYASGNTAIATVNDAGVATGVAAGSTQITATSEGKSGSVSLTVSTTQIGSVTVTPPSVTVNVGATVTLAGAAFDAGGAPLPGRVFAWSSGNPAIATVTSLGVVRGMGAGTVTITGTSEEKSATSTATVIVPPVATVTVAPATATVGLGDSLQLRADVKDAAGNILTGRSVTWQSSNGLVASVSATGKVRALAPGDATITATSEGKSGTAAIGARLRFSSVSAGQDFTCGVTPVRTIFCWGRNANGSLGDGTTTDRLVPVAVSKPLGVLFDSVSAGQDHACGLSTAGTVYCWGTNTFGQLGTGNTTPQTAPTLISASGLSFTSVSAAAQFSCAVTTVNTVRCWGFNDNGQLGTAPGTPGSANPTPLEVTGGPFRAVSATQGHACGILTGGGGQDGTVVCWGLNDFGQLGRGGGNSPPFDERPGLIFGSVRYALVSGGLRFTCAIRSDGSSVTDCWGLNDLGQLGAPSPVGQNFNSVPGAVNNGLQLATVSTGNALACGVASNGQGLCWGDNTFGKLGTGSNTPPSTSQPQPVSGGLTFAAIDAGHSHACGITTENVAWCWGRAQDGLHPGASALGNGGTGQSNVPVKVSGQQ